MELIKKNIHMNKLKCKNDLQVTLDDDFNVPDVKPDIYKIIKEQGEVKIHDLKISNGKMLVQGVLGFNVLYLSDESDRPIYNISSEIPLEEVVYLDGVEVGDDASITVEVEDLSSSLINSRKINVRSIVTLNVFVDELYDEATAVSAQDDDGEDRILDVELVIEMGIKVYQDENLELLYDLYSTSKDVKPVWKETCFENLIVKNNSKTRLNDRVKINKNQPSILQICHAAGNAKIDDIFVVEDGLEVNGIIEVQILYISSDDQIPLNTIKSMIPFTQLIEVKDIKDDDIYDINAKLEQLSVMMLDSEEIEVKAGISVNAIVFNKINTRIINDVEISEFDKEEIQNMPSVIGYIVKSNESLWDIAKRFRTTKLKLIELNDLEDEFVRSGDKILISKQLEQFI